MFSDIILYETRKWTYLVFPKNYKIEGRCYEFLINNYRIYLKLDAKIIIYTGDKDKEIYSDSLDKFISVCQLFNFM